MTSETGKEAGKERRATPVVHRTFGRSCGFVEVGTDDNPLIVRPWQDTNYVWDSRTSHLL